MKKLANITEKTNNISKGIASINEKSEKVKKSYQSIKFFFNIYVICIVVKETIRSIKKLTREGLKKEFALACVKNASKIAKMI